MRGAAARVADAAAPCALAVLCTAARTADGMRAVEDEPVLFVHLHGPVPTGRVPVAGLAAVRRADEAAGIWTNDRHRRATTQAGWPSFVRLRSPAPTPCPRAGKRAWPLPADRKDSGLARAGGRGAGRPAGRAGRFLRRRRAAAGGGLYLLLKEWPFRFMHGPYPVGAAVPPGFVPYFN